MNEPWWIALIEALIIVNIVLGLFAYLTLIERKLMGRMQLRYGPNRAGKFGLLQPIADLVKLVRKEAFAPSAAIDLPYILAPIVSAFTAIAVNAETTGARMYGSSIADDGENASLRTSFTRSAIGCSSPKGPARFGP